MIAKNNSQTLSSFAFQTGHWRVRHRKLEGPLTGHGKWFEFEGTCRAVEILDGAGNVDDFVIDDPAGAYRAATFRRLDPLTGEWCIYWADGRRSGFDPEMRGRFENGVGTFLGQDVVHGQDVFVRFIWSDIAPSRARWEQAFSTDREVWEVNWIMQFERMEEPNAR